MERRTWASKTIEIDLDSENYGAINPDALNYGEILPEYQKL